MLDSKCALRTWIADMDNGYLDTIFVIIYSCMCISNAKGGWRGVTVQYSQPSRLYICTVAHLVYNVPNLLKYIRSRLYLIIATTEVIVVPSDQLQTWLLSQCSVLHLFVKEDVCEVQSSQCVVSSSESKLQDEAQQVLSKSVLLSSRVTSSVKVLLRYGDFMKLLFKCCC